MIGGLRISMLRRKKASEIVMCQNIVRVYPERTLVVHGGTLGLSPDFVEPPKIVMRISILAVEMYCSQEILERLSIVSLAGEEAAEVVLCSPVAAVNLQRLVVLSCGTRGISTPLANNAEVVHRISILRVQSQSLRKLGP